MPEWLTILIISTVFALVSYIFITEIGNLKGIIKELRADIITLEDDLKKKPPIEEVISLKGDLAMVQEDLRKRPKAEEVMTLSVHAQFCKENTTQMLTFIKEQTQELKTYFDMKIENEILKELRDINGRR